MTGCASCVALFEAKQKLNAENIMLRKQIEMLKSIGMFPVKCDVAVQADINHEYESTGFTQCNGSTVSEIVAQAAQDTIDSQIASDYIFDNTSQMYYSLSTGYYYDTNSHMFYHPTTEKYYFLDEKTQTYKPWTDAEQCKQYSHLFTSTKLQKLAAKFNLPLDGSVPSEVFICVMQLRQDVDDQEDGEIDDSDPDVITGANDSSDDDSDQEIDYAPCIRAMVCYSSQLTPGSLHIITTSGVTLGTADDNSFPLNDTLVLPHHAFVSYDQLRQEYCLQLLDPGSTCYINHELVSNHGGEKEIRRYGPVRVSLVHGCSLIVGNTEFILHIHNGINTCLGCEPGVQSCDVQAEIEPPKMARGMSREGSRRKELRRMKNQYAISRDDDDTYKMEQSKYQDRSKRRRKLIGSDNPYLPDSAPSSLNVPIASENKGFKMLKTLGWSEGKGLGREDSSITEPINPQSQVGTSGLGSSAKMPANKNSRRNSNWAKARNRFEQIK